MVIPGDKVQEYFRLMAKKPKNLSPQYQVWVDARRRFHLSHMHIQMARELGMNPKKFGGKANHRQEPWKLPLPQFIEQLYFKRFGKERPESICSIEQMVWDKKRKKAERKARKQLREEAGKMQNAGPAEQSGLLTEGEKL